MNKRMRMAAGVIGLSFAVLAVAALSQRVAADDDEPIVVPKKSKEAVNKMADDIAKGNKVGKEADLFFKDNKEPLKKTMWIFKPREEGGKGGVGIGAKPGVYEPDGIELFLINQSGQKPKMKLNLKKVRGRPQIASPTSPWRWPRSPANSCQRSRWATKLQRSGMRRTTT